MAYSFVDVHEVCQKVDQLQSTVDALTQRLDSAATVNLSPLVGQLAAGLANLEQRMSQLEQQIAQSGQRHEQSLADVRAAIPPTVDISAAVAPIVTAIAEMVQKFSESANQTPVDTPGLATLAQGLLDTLKMQREMCARMDKPVVREGIADLPSGQVKLRITETRTR